MDELIGRVAAAAGIDEATAHKAVGVVFDLISKEGDSRKVAELFDKVPGAAALAQEGAADSGGFFGALGGPAMAAFGKLNKAGMSPEQMKSAGKELLAYAEEIAGPELVKDVANSIPGLAKFV